MPASNRARLRSAASARREHDAQLAVAIGDALDVSPPREQRQGGRVVTANGERRAIASGNLLDRALRDDAALVDDRDVVARLLDLVEEVRGEEVVPPSSTKDRTSRGTPGSRPGRARSSARRGSAAPDRPAGSARSQPLPHAQRIRLHAIARARASPTRSSAASIRPNAARPRAAAARGSRDRSGAGTSAPRRSRRRGERRGPLLGDRQPRSSSSPRSPSSAQEHPDQGRLARPVRAEVAERAGLGYCQVNARDRLGDRRSITSPFVSITSSVVMPSR